MRAPAACGFHRLLPEGSCKAAAGCCRRCHASTYQDYLIRSSLELLNAMQKKLLLHELALHHFRGECPVCWCVLCTYSTLLA